MSDFDRTSTLVVLDGSSAGGGMAPWRDTELETRRLDDESPEDLRGLFSRYETVVVDAADPTVSRVATAFGRMNQAGGTVPTLCPLDGPGMRTVASWLGATEVSEEVVGRLCGSSDLRAIGRGEQLPTLRVTPSVEEAPLYGCTFGGGLLYTAFEAYRRGTGAGFSGLRSAVTEVAGELAESSAGGGESGRMTVDYEPEAEQIGFALASSLPRTWLGLSLGDRGKPTYMAGREGGESLRKLLRAGALPSSVHAEGRSFGCLHLDWSGGYVLDGRLRRPDRAYVLEVAAGPSLDAVAIESS
ncbi:MAG: hypothetical protein ABEL76_00730 [Bradymonadaceae bacterium]